MKLCPKCAAQSSTDAWLCSCGYEFTGREPLSPLSASLTTTPLKTWITRAFCVSCGLALLGYLLVSPNSPYQRPSVVRAILTWGRLAPFPQSAQVSSITATGNMFSRGFRVSFTAPAPDIEQWLRQSPGTRDLIPDVPAPGFRYFQIEPGGGAQGAQVSVDDRIHRVSVYVYWS